MLIGSNINKSYGEKRILTDVSASVEPGQITALIGPSGSGKSTLLRALALLDPPDQGTITIDEMRYVFPGKNGAKLPTPWPKLTIVFQQLFLWPHLTLRENITLSAGNDDGESEKLHDLINQLSLREFIDRYPDQVSLGQRQRAAIARALALEPKYLLLDEVTSALDIEHVSKLLDHLKTLRNRGTGILLITHLIGFAKRSADQILFMQDGTILEAGGPELMLSPKTRRLAEFLSLVDTAS